MPFYDSSQEWLKQSTLLFQAYPTSSRVTTKYKIQPPPPPESRKRKRKQPTLVSRPSAKAAQTADETPPPTEQKPAPAAQVPTPAVPKATITLKTYDPVSGICLKYRTDKAAEVGRLIASLGRLGKHMAALPDADADGEVDKAMEGAAAGAADGDGVDNKQAEQNEPLAPTPAAGEGGDAKGAQQGKSGGGGGGGGGKKKKKGKK